MKNQNMVLTLAIAASVLLFVVSIGAILLDDCGSSYTFTSLQGEKVTI